MTLKKSSSLLRTCHHGCERPWQLSNGRRGTEDQEVHGTSPIHGDIPVTKVVYCMSGASWLTITPVCQFLHQLGTRPSY